MMFLTKVKKLNLKISKSKSVKDNLPLLKNLPSIFFFTDRKKFNDIFKVIEKLPKNCGIIIREYDLQPQERLKFAQRVKKIARKKSLKIFAGKDYKLKLTNQIKADGVHFSDKDLQILNKNNCLKSFLYHKSKILISFSCHNLKTVKIAQNFGANLIFYSPIFTTESHPNQKPVGVLSLRKICFKIKTPIYALGGINKKNINKLNNCKIAGIAGISIFNKN